MTRLLFVAVCVALVGCGEEKAAAPPSNPNPPASDLFDNKTPPPNAKGKAGAG